MRSLGASVLVVVATAALAGCGNATTAGTPVVAPQTTQPTAQPTVVPSVTALPTAAPTTSAAPAGCSVTLVDDMSGFIVRGRGNSGGFSVSSDDEGPMVGCSGQRPLRVTIRPSKAVVFAIDGHTAELAAGATEEVGPYTVTVLRVGPNTADVDLAPF